MSEPKDFLNRNIKLGDVCIYPVRRGSKMNLHRLTVQKIANDLDGSVTVSGTRADGYQVKITSLERLVIVGRNNIIPFLGEDD